MVWPVAALAVLALGFVIAYGSVVQARLQAAFVDAADPPRDSEAVSGAAETSGSV